MRARRLWALYYGPWPLETPVSASVNLMDSRAILLTDIGFYTGTGLWALQEPLCRIHVLSDYEEY